MLVYSLLSTYFKVAPVIVKANIYKCKKYLIRNATKMNSSHPVNKIHVKLEVDRYVFFYKWTLF